MSGACCDLRGAMSARGFFLCASCIASMLEGGIRHSRPCSRYAPGSSPRASQVLTVLSPRPNRAATSATVRSIPVAIARHDGSRSGSSISRSLPIQLTGTVASGGAAVTSATSDSRMPIGAVYGLRSPVRRATTVDPQRLRVSSDNSSDRMAVIRRAAFSGGLASVQPRGHPTPVFGEPRSLFPSRRSGAPPLES